MTVLYDADISGAGSDVLAGSEIWYAAILVSTPPDGARLLEGPPLGHYLRMGYVSFGSTLSVIGGTAIQYSRAPIWLDFIDTMWTPIPSTVNGQVQSMVADSVHWWIPPGGLAHLYVYGA